MQDLEKRIGKDIKQAIRYAERTDKEVSELQAKLQAILDDQKKTYDALVAAVGHSREAWAYVQHLEKIEKQ